MKTIFKIGILFFFAAISIQAQNLHEAVSEGDISKVRSILNEKPDLIDAKNARGMTALNLASYLGHEEIAVELIAGGANPSLGANDSTQPIHYASQSGKVEILKKLIEKGIDVNVREDSGSPPLHYACIGGHFEAFQYLTDNGADIKIKANSGATTLHHAVSGGNIDIVRYLLEKGADVNEGDNWLEPPISWGARPHSYEAVKLLIEKGADVNNRSKSGRVPLHNVGRGGSKKTVDLLLEAGADINAVDIAGWPMILFISFDGNAEMVEYLILKGADVNQSKEVLKEYGPYILTPLHAAVQTGSLETVKVLVDSGAKINIIDPEENTPLFYAVRDRNINIAEYLIENGAFLNGKSKIDGYTCLHFSAIKGFEDLAELLIASGADVTLQDKHGKTPLDYAIYYGFNKIAYKLLAKGADDNIFKKEFKKPELIKKNLSPGEASIWHLGNSGWAVKTKTAFLVFDYMVEYKDEHGGDIEIEKPSDASISSGFIIPEQIKDLDVYIFLPRVDNVGYFSDKIFEWKKLIPDVSFISGFQAQDILGDYTYIKPRISQKINELTVTAFKANQNGNGFLVEVDGVTVLHSGDHVKGTHQLDKSFEPEIDYLKSLNKNIDIAFFPIDARGMRRAKLYEGIKYSIESLEPHVFLPSALYPIHTVESSGLLYKSFKQQMDNENLTTQVEFPVNRGDRFSYKNRKIVK